MKRKDETYADYWARYMKRYKKTPQQKTINNVRQFIKRRELRGIG